MEFWLIFGIFAQITAVGIFLTYAGKFASEMLENILGSLYSIEDELKKIKDK